MNCKSCKWFESANLPDNSGFCFANPPVPIKWHHSAKNVDGTQTVKVLQFGPTRTYGEFRCGLYEDTNLPSNSEDTKP